MVYRMRGLRSLAYKFARFGENLQHTHANLSHSSSLGAEVVGRRELLQTSRARLGFNSSPSSELTRSPD
jgi:hypothetical protein